MGCGKTWQRVALILHNRCCSWNDARQRWSGRKQRGSAIRRLSAPPNRITDQLGTLNAFTVCQGWETARRPERLFAFWSGTNFAWSGRSSPQATPMARHAGIDVATRLWAPNARELLKSRKLPRPLTRAIRYQLVTLTTGAVVWRRPNIQRCRLRPVDPGSVPAVPEPRTWVLLF